MPIDNTTFLHDKDKNIYRLTDAITINNTLRLYCTTSFVTTLSKLIINVEKINLEKDINDSELIFATIKLLNQDGNDTLSFTNIETTITSIWINFTSNTQTDRKYNIIGTFNVGIREYTGNEGIANVYYRPNIVDSFFLINETIPTSSSGSNVTIWGRTTQDTDVLIWGYNKYYVEGKGMVVLIPLIN